MIEVTDVTIKVGEYVLESLNFRVETGQYAIVMGKTGVGKTTILEAICGLRQIQSGEIRLGGVDVSRWSPGERNIGYTPQDLALFPTLNVREHLEFALKLRRTAAAVIDARVSEMARLLEIDKLLDRRIHGLSGGEAQRVALGRALSFGPTALLLDEPLSALDADTRLSTQGLLRRLNKESGVTVIHVTHNQEDADALADCCLHLVTDESTGRIVMR